MRKVFQDRRHKVFLLQHITKMETKRQKQDKKRVPKKNETVEKKGSRMGLYSFTYQCPKCLTEHQGTLLSKKPEMEIQCLESIEDNMISVTDEHFVLWLAEKHKGKKLRCNHVHYIKGRPVFNKKTKQRGHHKLYDGEFDEKVFKMLEDRAKRRSIYL